ncbi:hypothetical protein [Streptomyces sp. NPDC058623]|uniref:hypothetical protein n=1 Tax=Streptomyces sp. NPDC058623 TaxID=3346563 RepID=UPI0036612ACD
MNAYVRGPRPLAASCSCSCAAAAGVLVAPTNATAAPVAAEAPMNFLRSNAMPTPS